MNGAQPACLAIADISGYTGYLARVELEHAQDILADLMSTVVGALRPMFRLAKLEGDAAFCFVLTDRVDGSQLQDTVEGCYFRFRRRLRDIRQATSCECNACTLMPSLNLKTLVHHGEVVVHKVVGQTELVGSDVIVAHRLLKNRVEEDLGMRAYALYTEPCLRAAAIDPGLSGLIPHREEYEYVGEVTCWLRDLEAAWSEEQGRARVEVPRERATVLEFDAPAPPPVMWGYLTSPELRPKWQNMTAVEAGPGRRGVGTVNHCVHGREVVVEEILDWRPYDYATFRFEAFPGAPKVSYTLALSPNGEGTRVEFRFERPRSARGKALMAELLPTLEADFVTERKALLALLDQEATRVGEFARDVSEAEVPPSAGRHLSAPSG